MLGLEAKTLSFVVRHSLAIPLLLTTKVWWQPSLMEKIGPYFSAMVEKVLKIGIRVFRRCRWPMKGKAPRGSGILLLCLVLNLFSLDDPLGDLVMDLNTRCIINKAKNIDAAI